ncbi:hypothetical protein BDD12DRAFT_898540 [Trichophaea hybrida]|nr:hypothetical protein BDD12DRAFT_898540 [Trichophaea hybrida]
MAACKESMSFLFNHIFLPPQLPQNSESDTSQREQSLLELLATAVKDYQSSAEGEHVEKLGIVHKMLLSLAEIRCRGRGGISADVLKEKIVGMACGDVIVLHIAAQNAGMVLRHTGKEIRFESFEVSPTAAEVMAATGRLICSYPGPIIAVGVNIVQNTSFAQYISSMLEQLDSEIILQTIPVPYAQPRDTASPMLITGMLTGILRGLGRHIESAELRIQKHVRDDVMWVCDSPHPCNWRRSPLWLVLRVALQTTLRDGDNHTLYKSFMSYFMATILEQALEMKWNNASLFVMNAKLSRRELKAESVPEFVQHRVSQAVHKVSNYLRGLWHEIQAKDPPNVRWIPDGLSFQEDTNLSLANSKGYIEALLNRSHAQTDYAKFVPSEPTRIHNPIPILPSFPPSTMPRLELCLPLFDIEKWVENKLDGWLTDNIHREESCKDLGNLIEQYTNQAMSTYDKNPESFSIMLLTTLELWVALDKTAVRNCKLLEKYSPELSQCMLEPLLLPKKSQMIRLRAIEKYIQHRHDNADVLDNPRILSDQICEESFAVSFFNESSYHQRLETEIEDQAKKDRERKKEEYHNKHQEYNDLWKDARAKKCEYTSVSKRAEYHSPNCRRCSLERQAKNMRIAVHEWPLPVDELRRKVAVFELHCPLAFWVWRDTTYRILLDICTPNDDDKYKRNTPQGKSLSKFFEGSNLMQYHRSDNNQRLSLSSTMPPVVSPVQFPIGVGDILLSNGTKYDLYDGKQYCWVSSSLNRYNVRKMCTLQLPAGLYRNMQDMVDKTTHTSNDVIATQHKCSAGLSLHEYEAFGELRAGHRIQWINIARELRSRNLTWRNESVALLVMQAIWQAGPYQDGAIDLEEDTHNDLWIRESHLEPATPQFGVALLKEIEEIWETIRENWQESVTAHSLIALTSRILSCNSCAAVKSKAVELLRKARQYTFTWSRDLANKLDRTRAQRERIAGDNIEQNPDELRFRLLQVAAICRTTYDVDQAELCQILSSDHDVEVAVECAIVLYDNSPVNTNSLSPFMRSLLDRDRRLSMDIEHELRRLVISLGMDQCITHVRGEYVPSGRWGDLAAPNERWVVTEMKRTGDSEQGTRQVHYNLLNGQLLINGSPMRRLPSKFVEHPTYFRTFGEKLFDVRPSYGNGYESKSRHDGFQIYFSMESNELLIKIEKDGRIQELIPEPKLKGDFPHHMVANYAHWMDIQSQIIEFRPLKSQWNASESGPKLDYRMRSLEMHREGKRLFDVRSCSAQMIHSVLQPLEHSNFIEITIANHDSTVEVKLPRLNLVFFINDNRNLECRQFRNMIIDDNQAFGALTGLQNRLVLRDKNKQSPVDARIHCRKVLVPRVHGLHGKIEGRIHGSHVKIAIDNNDEKIIHVEFHAFDIDSTLCRLVGNSSLLSRLYKIYLHALTSHCLPDSLTGRTGTEEALHDLNSAAVWSFKELESGDLAFLQKIAALTPTRNFHPKYIPKTQHVGWGSSLSPWSQHDEFYLTVKRILEHNSRFKIFLMDDSEQPSLGDTNQHLVARAATRSATIQPHAFGGSNVSLRKDHPYKARDIPSAAAQSLEAKVCTIARMAEQWPTRLDTVTNLLHRFNQWCTLGCTAPVSLGYQSRLLEAKLADVWLPLHDICRNANRDDRYGLMFLLSTLIYAERIDSGGPINMQLIWTLLAFATVPAATSNNLVVGARGTSYNPTRGHKPNSDLMKKIEDFEVDYSGSQESNMPQNPGESSDEWNERKLQLFEKNLASQKMQLEEELKAQWIWKTINGEFPSSESYSLLRIADMRTEITSLFEDWYKNLQLYNHTERTQKALNEVRETVAIIPSYVFSPSAISPNAPISPISLVEIRPSGNYIASTSPALSLSSQSRMQHLPRDEHLEPVPRDERLEALLTDLKRSSSSTFENDYAKDLEASLSAFEEQSDRSTSGRCIYRRINQGGIANFHRECQNHLESMFGIIQKGLNSPRVTNSTQKLLDETGLWPRITPTSLLSLLAAPTSANLDPEWKRILVDYGLALARFQWATRLYNLELAGSQEELMKELENEGHSSWDPMDHPDWLLLEIENNLLIRPIQVDTAYRMISPPDCKNSVFQLNMGEGKSSVIVPIVSAALANGSKLVRVVVLKPLLTQMFHLLVQKLGGLTNRRIFFMPFYRGMELNSDTANQIQGLYEECLRTRGILLVQPEHLLSFKLMGFEKLADVRTKRVSEQLIRTQSWLKEKARDVLDESDEILHVRYQLIYTLELQSLPDHAPYRWIVVQHVLDLVLKYAKKLQVVFPDGIEIDGDSSQGRFPSIRILEKSAGRKLTEDLRDAIYRGELPDVPFRLWPDAMRNLVLRFISDPSVTKDGENLFDYTKLPNWKTLLLLRGLLAHGILLMIFRDKRWKVDYGLDEKRKPPTLLAVPYRAKDSPALAADFSHPDMAITLTCLSYYYGGLTSSQLDISFQRLLKSDDPSGEYKRWVRNSVPENIRTLQGSTLKTAVIDFYLSNVVFPKDAREFPFKLSTSGWDLAEQRSHTTTGFSGTNDNRFLLPLSIVQKDVGENAGTNAKVLSYLLKEENNHYQHIALGPGETGKDKAEVLLKMIFQESAKIRVLLDVGAQILSKNKEVAAKILEYMAPDEAVVYFDKQDELIVERHDGITEKLAFSSFAKQLDKTFVYLDEAHTRGTDLKLPIGSRAAVTLGPKLTKDKLAQACMRMRQLGHGHRIMYFAPSEVHQKIAEIASQRNAGSRIQAVDVLRWAINETQFSITQSFLLWSAQGLSYHIRRKAWLRYCHSNGGDGDKLIEELKERESQTLEEMYGFKGASPISEIDHMNMNDDENAVAIRKKYDYFGTTSSHDHARLLEEREREVAQETEKEKMVELPASAKASKHLLSVSLRDFVHEGKEPVPGTDITLAVDVFLKTSAREDMVDGWSKRILATRDFGCTVEEGGGHKLDNYLRRVSWVVSSVSNDINNEPCWVIISPYEANELIQDIRRSRFVRLNVYSPRVSQDMTSFEKLDFFSISSAPPSPLNRFLIRELNILAGQLYLANRREYKLVCGFFGLCLDSVEDDDEGQIDSNGGFISWERRMELGIGGSSFKSNPVSFAQAILKLRRKGEGYLETHMGKLLRAVRLHEEDFRYRRIPFSNVVWAVYPIINSI